MSSKLPQTTPEAVGVSSTVLLDILRRLDSVHWVHHLRIARRGQVILDACRAPYSRQTPHALFSLSKSFTALAIGFLQQEKRVNLSDKVLDIFPQYRANLGDEHLNQLTIRHTLMMATGHDHDIAYEMVQSPEVDWLKSFFALPLKSEPGTQFCYNSAATYLLAAVVRQLTGENVRAYLMPRLFEPLGMHPGRWEQSPQGIDCGGWGLYLTIEDLAKFAEFLRNRGTYNGKVLLDPEFLQAATSRQIDTSFRPGTEWQQGYGYQFWRSTHGFRGDGANGQFALIVPEAELTICGLSGTSAMPEIFELFWTKLLPGLHPSSLPDAAPEIQQELQREQANWHIPVLPGKWRDWPDSRHRKMRPNAAGWEFMELTAPGHYLELTFGNTQWQEKLKIGFGEFQYSTLRHGEWSSHPVAASGEWLNAQELHFEVLYLDSAYRDEYTLNLAQHSLHRHAHCALLRQALPDLFFE